MVSLSIWMESNEVAYSYEKYFWVGIFIWTIL